MTTPTAEQIAAAERRKAWKESMNYPDCPARSPYGADNGFGRKRISDCMLLADFALAVMQWDGGEAVTDEWLESIAPYDRCRDAYCVRLPAPRDNEYKPCLFCLWWADEETLIAELQSENRQEWKTECDYDCCDHDSVCIVAFDKPTRAQVRALLAALGIK